MTSLISYSRGFLWRPNLLMRIWMHLYLIEHLQKEKESAISLCRTEGMIQYHHIDCLDVVQVCKRTFMFLYDLGGTKMDNIKRHYNRYGLAPRYQPIMQLHLSYLHHRVHGNTQAALHIIGLTPAKSSTLSNFSISMQRPMPSYYQAAFLGINLQTSSYYHLVPPSELSGRHTMKRLNTQVSVV